MSTPGSVRSGGQSPYSAPKSAGGVDAGNTPAARAKRRRFFRWQGVVPIMLAAVLAYVGWLMFGERTIRDTLAEAGTKALGAQLDIETLRIHTRPTSIDLNGVALADPFDRLRNLFEIASIRVELEPRPLLEKKIVVRRLSIADVRTGTQRARPATAVTGAGFAPRALAEVQQFAKQFKVPLLSLTPFDTLKSIALDPTQLKAVQAALSLARTTDSARIAIETGYSGLQLQQTLDSSTALLARLQGTDVRTLGIDGARRAIADVRRAVARVDSTKGRVDRLVTTARRQIDSLDAGVRRVNEAKTEDYAFARSLLQLPSFEGPDIGSALFGKVTIDRFQQAVYWSTLARQYAPPGLLPKESPGPKRVRRSGSTIHFAARQDYPRFLLRRANVNVVVSAGTETAGTYSLAASDVTTDPAIVGRPTLFAARRVARGSDVDSVRVTGALDHTTSRLREVVSAQAVGVKLPRVAIPSLPYAMDPGRGTSEMRFVLENGQVSGRWVMHADHLVWRADSARSRRLNALESLVVRVLTGIKDLDLTADVSGTLEAPRLVVRSNLDRQVAERLRAVAGEEIGAAQAKVRAQVDKLVEEKSAPVRARIDELRAESERHVAEARTRLEEEKHKLEERIKALGGRIVGLPKLPGME